MAKQPIKFVFEAEVPRDNLHRKVLAQPQCAPKTFKNKKAYDRKRDKKVDQ